MGLVVATIDRWSAIAHVFVTSESLLPLLLS